MRYFILTFLISTGAFGGDCLQEYYNYHAGLKFTGSFNDLYDTHKANPDLNVICKDKAKNEIWEEERKGMATGIAEKKDELNKAHKLSTGDLDLLNIEDAIYVGNADICSRLDKAIKEKDNCYEPIEYTKKLRTTDIVSMRFEEVCKLLGPDIIRRIKVCKYKN
jgi:hypothetical protein